MELRQLRYFVKVAEETNISRAAQKLFLTQPALSRQIKSLEDEIGQCLLERQAHSITLTPAGATLLHEARDLLQRADLLLERVRSSAQTVRLRVGYAPSLASGLLSAAVENFAQKHPNVRIELFDLSTREVLAGLENDSLDVALTVAPDQDRHSWKWTPLLRVPWQLAVHRQHPLARRSSVTPEETGREPLLVFCQKDYPEYWHTVMEWLRQHRQRPTISGEYDGVNSLLSAVESGLGIALVTTSTAPLVPQRVRLKQLSAPPTPVCIAAGHLVTRTVDKPLAVFIEELRAVARSFPA